jgi:hypothetical protein
MNSQDIILNCDVDLIKEDKSNINWNSISTVNMPLSYNTVQISIQNHNFSTKCPYYYDSQNIKHTTRKDLCFAIKNSKYCTFRVNNSIITKGGGITGNNNNFKYRFSHFTMNGLNKDSHNRNNHIQWSEYFEKATKGRINKINSNNIKSDLDSYAYVVPLRMRFDDCFNHLSFQAVPLISMVKEFHSDIWDILYWHASIDTASLLNLAGVSLDRIIIDKPIIAETIILPWIPGWSPMQYPLMNGISNQLVQEITKNLLNKNLSIPDPQILDPKSENYLKLSNIKFLTPPLSLSNTNNEYRNVSKRLIIYFTRGSILKRGVINEKEILDALVKHVSDDYDIVTIDLQNEFHSINNKQYSW